MLQSTHLKLFLPAKLKPLESREEMLLEDPMLNLTVEAGSHHGS
jgi:hypothetical protein